MKKDRRSDTRLVLHSPVAVTGIDEAGRQFTEQSRLENVSDQGCCFSIEREIPRAAIVSIEPLGPDGERFPDEYARLFVVIWVEYRNGRFSAGTRCLVERELSDESSPFAQVSSK